MTRQLVTAELDGRPFLVSAEVVNSDLAAVDVADHQRRIEDSLEVASVVASKIAQSLAGIGVERISAEFGIQFVVKSGKLLGALVEAGAEASFKLTLEFAPEAGAGGGA